MHLRPEFQGYLEQVFETWNDIQETVRFVGLRPSRKAEHLLLPPGAISDDDASLQADRIRVDAGYSTNDGIVVFTEKRLYDDRYGQLFVGGREADEEPPRIAILSLQFLRAAYEGTAAMDSMLFRAILSNILLSSGVDAGLEDHGTEIRGCIMDFSDHMPDFEAGLKHGPKFCSTCAKTLRACGSAFVVELARATRKFPNLAAADPRHAARHDRGAKRHPRSAPTSQRPLGGLASPLGRTLRSPCSNVSAGKAPQILRHRRPNPARRKRRSRCSVALPPGRAEARSR
jgi:predicted Zn-dependent protease